MFIFYFLGVGLPWRLIFCQFWLCEEAQCVYLRCHLGSPETFFFLIKMQQVQGLTSSEAYEYQGMTVKHQGHIASKWLSWNSKSGSHTLEFYDASSMESLIHLLIYSCIQYVITEGI